MGRLGHEPPESAGVLLVTYQAWVAIDLAQGWQRSSRQARHQHTTPAIVRDYEFTQCYNSWHNL